MVDVPGDRAGITLDFCAKCLRTSLVGLPICIVRSALRAVLTPVGTSSFFASFACVPLRPYDPEASERRRATTGA